MNCDVQVSVSNVLSLILGAITVRRLAVFFVKVNLLHHVMAAFTTRVVKIKRNVRSIMMEIIHVSLSPRPVISLSSSQWPVVSLSSSQWPVIALSQLRRHSRKALHMQQNTFHQRFNQCHCQYSKYTAPAVDEGTRIGCIEKRQNDTDSGTPKFSNLPHYILCTPTTTPCYQHSLNLQRQCTGPENSLPCSQKLESNEQPYSWPAAVHSTPS